MVTIPFLALLNFLSFIHQRRIERKVFTNQASVVQSLKFGFAMLNLIASGLLANLGCLF